MRALWVALFVASCATAPAIAPPSPAAFGKLQASRDLDGTVLGPSTAHATIVIVFASWCEHCRQELGELATLRSDDVRIVGVNYKGHEEYDHRGGAAAVRAFAHDTAPWLRIVSIDDDLYDAIGRPPVIPVIFVYDRNGALVQTYDRRLRTPPNRDELAALLAKLRT